MDDYLDIKFSLMGADDPGIGGPSLGDGQMGDDRSVSDSSPLQDFVKAKKKICEIFVEIEKYVRDTDTCRQSVQQVGSCLKSNDAVQVEGYIAGVRAIQNILTRNHMKVAFFGRTSNGKSSVINAMLREKILPSCYGHTTNCFLQVEGSDSGESYLKTADSTEKQNVTSVGQLAHALSKEKLGESQLVHIYWPKDKCLHLRNEVVFVDSPGIDMSCKLDEWIDKYCLDADVFVFVANAESTIIQAEKNFFHKVLERVSKPNIFILNNRWDLVASESDFLDQVREQHVERAVEFLVAELKVCTENEANERIFFVSAKEALQAHLQEQKGLPAHNGFPDRYREFQDFERKFEECIANSAVRTKFEQHSKRGKDIVSEIRQIIVSTYDQAQQLKTQKAVAKKEIYGKLNFTEQQLLLLTQEMKEKIQQVVKDVEQKVSKALSEEICYLSVLVDEFNLPFKPEQRDLNEYKEKIHHHVENGLGSKLHARLSTEFAINIENSQLEMTEGCYRYGFHWFSRSSGWNTGWRFWWFAPGFRSTCKELSVNLCKCVDGNDVTFQVGWVRVVSRLIPKATTAVTAAVATAATAVVAAAAVEVTLIGGRYVYKRLKWDNKAKEREFKRQFVAHVTKKQQLIVDSTSSNYSKEVEQELSGIFAQIRDPINKYINDMDAEIKTLDKEIKQLEEAANSAKLLWNKDNYITKQLETFDDEFLKLSCCF